MTTANLTRIELTRDSVLAHAQSLPAAPQVLCGLCELLQDVNTELEQVSAEIRMDPVLAARVIQLSNSVAFGGAADISSIDAAVNRVGFAEIVRLVGVATVAGLVDRSLQGYSIEAEFLRESLLLHALASEAVAGYTNLDVRAAYAGGLLRGVGMMVLDRMTRGRMDPAESYAPANFRTYTEWERAHFGLTSARVTGAILGEWRFPLELVGAIEQHLDDGCDDQFATVLNLAGGIVAARGLALAGDEKAWTVTPEKLAIVGIDDTQWQAACAQAHAVFEQQRQALY